MNTHKFFNLILALAFAFSFGWTPTQIAQASATLVVDTLSDINAVDGFCSLREAIIAANTDADYNDCTATGYGNDTITFNISGAITLGSTLPNIVSNYGTLTIDGTGQSVSISGNNTVRPLYVNAGASLSLHEITISNGIAERGGGLYNDGTLVLSATIVRDNQASWGGGIYSTSTGTVTINASIIRTNTATIDGAGLYNNHGTMIIENGSVIGGAGAGNMAIGGASAGGIFNYGGILTIDASAVSHNTSANGAGGIFAYGGTISITNSIISANVATKYYGGGISVVYQSLTTVINSTISNNSAKSGGGMYNYQSNPILMNVTFSGNTISLDGGGMYNYQSNPSLSDVTFNANTAANSGGGMYNEASSPSLMNVTFNENATAGVGGGMYNYNYSNPTLTNVIFNGNSAEHGGGMRNYHYSSPNLTNVTFSSNRASHSGGGLFSWDRSNPTLMNVTFSANTASVNGGGMYNYLYSSPHLTNVTFSANSAIGIGGGMYNEVYSTPVIQDSILWGNGTESSNDGTSSPVINDSLIQGGCPAGATCNANILNADPLLGALANNGGFTQTIALGAGSPAIDVGNNTTCSTTDQRGTIRPQDGDGNGTVICDMGAFEYVRPLNQPPVANAGGPYTVDRGAALTLDGSGSTDPDNSITLYEWDLNADGVYDVTGATTIATFTQVGDHPVTLRVTDDGGLSDTDTAIVTVTDPTPPAITPTVSGTEGNNGWYTSNVTVSWDVSDPESGIASSVGCDTTTLTAETMGDTLTCSATNGAGLSNSASVTISIDKTAPSITWVGDINDNDSFYFGDVPTTPTCTALDNLSGLDGSCVVSGYASTVGIHTLTATAKDNAGNQETETRTYTVLPWTLKGFYQPVDMNGIYNLVKNGSTVPLKFEILAGSTEQADIAYVKSLTYVQTSCDASPITDEVETTATGNTSLRYADGQFIYNWKTPNTAGKCYRVTMTTMDGSSLAAYFKLK